MLSNLETPVQLGNEILEGSHAVPAIPSAPERRFVIFFEESSVQGAGDRAGQGSIEPLPAGQCNIRTSP